jgi:tRNA pseudouridine(38-40) synthase
VSGISNEMSLALFSAIILLVFQFGVGFKRIGMRRIQPSFFLLKEKYKSTRLVRNVVTRNQLSTVADIPVDKINDVDAFVKRKVALTIGYQGSKYYGLQFDIREEFPTIEAELEKALFKLGCIRESNHKDLSKISWSRSSRTDKHVHSARLVISTKLEISLEWMKGEDQRMPALVKSLNLILPTDIRVLSACKVNQGFRAREACSWREYEYLLPRALLLSNFNDSHLLKHEQNEDKILSLFSKCLQRFEGSNSFHNFHRLSPKNLKGRLFTNGESEDDPKDAEDFSNIILEDNPLENTPVIRAGNNISISRIGIVEMLFRCNLLAFIGRRKYEFCFSCCMSDTNIRVYASFIYIYVSLISTYLCLGIATAQDRIAQINATFVAAENTGYVYNLYENWVSVTFF